ncbi:MAG: OmpA family protein [Pseudomonadota bacterium]
MTRFALMTAALILAAGPVLAAACGAGGDGMTVIEYETGVTALSAEDKARLATFAETAKFRDAVCIFAQVDAQGSEAANVQVAEGRAKTVERYLVSQGVPEDRILIAKQEEAFTFFGLLPDNRSNDRRVTVTYE